MSYADEVFIRNCRDILQNGVWDTDQAVRPRWEDDGAPAHTVKKFGIVNRYDLSREFPLLTLRRTYWKTAVDAVSYTHLDGRGTHVQRAAAHARPQGHHQDH